MSAGDATELRRQGRARGRRALVFAALAGVGVAAHVLFFALAPVPLGHGPEEVSSQPWVSWSGVVEEAESALVREQVVLLDAEPLFVPTAWNTASAMNEIARLRDETELFTPYPPQVSAVERIWRPAPVLAPALSLDPLMEKSTLAPFATMGREEMAVPRMSPRPAFIEVVRLDGDGRTVQAGVLEVPGSSQWEADWRPLEFLHVVDPRTAGGPPLRLNSSGDTGWDQAVAGAVTEHAALRQLPAGYYRIVVGP